MILEMKKEGKPEAEIKAAVMAAYGVDEVKAQFIIDIELGRIDGDIVIVDKPAAKDKK